MSESWVLGSVAILGDFNTHLGSKNCPGDQNLQGVLLQVVLKRCELSTVSQGALASEPFYTYCSGDVSTTVDYILMDVGAASLMDSCCTHAMDDLNTSDHLPLTVYLLHDVCFSIQSCKDGILRCKRIDLVEAEKSGTLDKFAFEIQISIEPLLTRVHDDGEVISNEIEQVAGLLINSAEYNIRE